MDSVSVFETGGCGFESRHVHNVVILSFFFLDSRNWVVLQLLARNVLTFFLAWGLLRLVGATQVALSALPLSI